MNSQHRGTRHGGTQQYGGTRQIGETPSPGPPTAGSDAELRAALAHPDASVRLRAALAAGTAADAALLGDLIARTRTEPDFYVRDMLTWALTRLPASDAVPALIDELESPIAQARSQALHTLSKIADPAAWPAITVALLTDEDDDVVRSAWRAAVVVVPDEARHRLARTLATQLGRGGIDVQRSLSRAFVELDAAAGAIVRDAASSPDPEVRAHALATEELIADPESGFAAHLEQARRVVATGRFD
ncbi:MAG: HEAT repeat domain-containing protein [Gordonia sp. (in: high G+C Gram-positive bacteria)]|uniref:HEAT repeat domain-containing protein n=1 Tax=Gordonia TaxID=2053 RepID=UPI0032664FE3